MYIVDFEFDGELLSDYGCILAGANISEDNVGLGSELKPENIKIHSIDKMVCSKYEDILTWESSIMKNPCNTDGSQESLYFSDHEVYMLSAWLNKMQFKKFHPVYDDGSFSELYYYGWFYVEAVRFDGNIIGFTLKFTANSPYAYSQERTISYSLSSYGNPVYLTQIFDMEEGLFTPDSIQITCRNAGKIQFSMRYKYNGTYSSYVGNTIIDNCQSGEVITMDYKTKTVKSTVRGYIIGKDFNYNFLDIPIKRNGETEFSLLDGDANFVIKYTPIRKVGVI